MSRTADRMPTLVKSSQPTIMMMGPTDESKESESRSKGV